MIDSIAVSNFKSLRQVTLGLSKLSLLVGPNNSGKTSVLQAISFLQQSIANGNLWFQGPWTDLGSYENLVFGHQKNERVTIQFTLSLSSNERDGILKQITPGSGMERLELDRVEITLQLDGNGLFSSSMSTKDELLWRYDRAGSGAWSARFGNRILNLGLAYGFIPVPGSASSNVSTPARELANAVAREFTSYTYHLSALRGFSHRGESAREDRYRVRPKDVGVHGENTISVLTYIRDDPEYKETVEKVSAWCDSFGFTGVIPRLMEGPTYTLNLFDKIVKVQSNLVDVGFGMNQLLPVILQCFYAPKGSLIMIEEPEIHLHPRLQADLADLFIDVLEYGNHLIVETHSPQLILRLQRRVAEKRLTPTDLTIYGFEKTPEGSKVSRIEFDQRGFLSQIPAGFFEEDFQESLEHLRSAFTKRKPDA